MMEFLISGIIIGELWFVALPSKNTLTIPFWFVLAVAWVIILAYFTAVDLKKRRETMTKVDLKATVNDIAKTNEWGFEFGSVQATMTLSKNGLTARKLKLEAGKKVTVSIEA